MILTLQRSSVLVAFVVSSLFAEKAHAYLDPGSGSIILQAAVATFLGAVLAIKIFWQRVKVFVVDLFSKQDDTKERSE